MHVLCAEDDEGLVYLLRSALEAANFDVTCSLNGEEGLHLLRTQHFDAAVIDYDMPFMSGLEVIQRSSTLADAPPIIMVTGAGNEEVAVQAMRLGASDYLVKDTSLVYLKILPSVIQQVIHERKLTQAHQAAERALQLEKERARLLTQFIQDASHEFRTPLSIINTSSYLLGRISKEPKQQVYLERIQEQSARIVGLVDRLILLARLDNTTALHVMPVVLNDLLQRRLEHKRRLLEEKNLVLCLELPDHPVTVSGNVEELSNAFTELIDNACQASHLGGMLYVTLQSEDATAIITVQDNGIGIAEEDLPHIFERFYRVDTAHSTPGFGLGLPIAARIIDLHHGDIRIGSEPGQGTKVVVSLPVNLS
jgi:two-component system, sensor histidine kinase